MDSHDHIDAEFIVQETYIVQSFVQQLESVRSTLQQTTPERLWHIQQAAGYANVPAQQSHVNHGMNTNAATATIGAYEQRIFEVARSFNDPWLPAWVQGWYGYELTGLWRLPTHPGFVIYLRQYGPYLNMLSFANNTFYLYGRGLFDPQRSQLMIEGWLGTPYGMPFQYAGTPHSSSTISGGYTRTDMGGQFQFDLERFA